MRHYEVMVILDPDLEERTVAPSLDTYLNVAKKTVAQLTKLIFGVVVVWHTTLIKKPKAFMPCLI